MTWLAVQVIAQISVPKIQKCFELILSNQPLVFFLPLQLDLEIPPPNSDKLEICTQTVSAPLSATHRNAHHHQTPYGHSHPRHWPNHCGHMWQLDFLFVTYVKSPRSNRGEGWGPVVFWRDQGPWLHQKKTGEQCEAPKLSCIRWDFHHSGLMDRVVLAANKPSRLRSKSTQK